MRRVALHEARTAEEVWALIGRLGARTLVFDVEPLVAVWATDTATLDAGVGETASGRSRAGAGVVPAAVGRPRLAVEGHQLPSERQAPQVAAGLMVGVGLRVDDGPSRQGDGAAGGEGEPHAGSQVR